MNKQTAQELEKQYWEYGGMLARARQLPDADLRRHASVSIRDQDDCKNCFCCAALQVLQEREAAARNGT